MTPKDRRDFYVKPEIPQPARFGLGLNKLVEESRRLSLKTAWVICPQKRNLQEGVVAAILGAAESKALHDGKIAVIYDGVEIVGHYATKLPSGAGIPILTVNLPKKRLHEVDDLANVPSLIVVPFPNSIEADGETKEWRTKHSPQLIVPPV